MYYQIIIYKNKKHIMENSEIYNKWTKFITSEKYKKYFLSNEDEWLNNLDNLKKYIDNNNKTPSQISKNKDHANISQWISRQKLFLISKNSNIMITTTILFI